jgi:uncharacterized protein
MKCEDIHQLLAEGIFPNGGRRPDLVETHISWVFIGTELVYKIKKPVHYSFLDFSTLQKRRYFCQREVLLNRRLTRDIYLGVVPVCHEKAGWVIHGTQGAVEDYAVCMRRMDPARRMDLLLREGIVTETEITGLADLIAHFHLSAPVVRLSATPAHQEEGAGMREWFNDLGGEADFLEGRCPGSGAIIRQSIILSDDFLHHHDDLMRARMRSGCYRDGHGDLHTRNIFLLARPQVFDCIEFNDHFRRIDVLNDVAFLCMDLDACGRRDLSALFYDRWNSSFAGTPGEADHRLFLYYKAYRANIRAKVNSYRARSAEQAAERVSALAASGTYLSLMQEYLILLKG